MELKRGYKRTDIGLIPEDWEVNKIGNFTTSYAGGTPNTKEPNYWGGDIKWMNSGELNNKFIFDVNNRITVEGVNNSSTKLIPEKCVLIGLAGQGKTRGTAAINYTKLCTNQSIASIFPSNNHNSEFLYYYIDNLYDKLRSLSTGDGGRGGLNLSIIRNLNIPLPTLEEQKQIGNVLSDTDQLIQNLKTLIAKKKAIKQGAMQELLAGKKRLQGFTEEWETKKLGEVAKIIMGQSPLSEFYNYEGVGLPLIQGNADIKNRKTIIRTFTSFYSKQAEKGDMIMTVRAPVGEIAKASFNCSIGRGVCAIKYSNDYLFYYLMFKENSWSQFSTGSTFDSIKSNQLKEFNIDIPRNIQEQQVIAQILSDMDAEIEFLGLQLQKTQTLKQGMMQELLTGKTRLIKPATKEKRGPMAMVAEDPEKYK